MRNVFTIWSCALVAVAAVVAVVACGGERLPVSSARPIGERWFCAHGSFSACGRDVQACVDENARIGSRVVNPGDRPTKDQCEEQPMAVCYTYVSPTVGKTLYDCFHDRIECEGYLKEAARAPGEHKELSVCGSWD